MAYNREWRRVKNVVMTSGYDFVNACLCTYRLTNGKSDVYLHTKTAWSSSSISLFTNGRLIMLQKLTIKLLTTNTNYIFQNVTLIFTL